MSEIAAFAQDKVNLPKDKADEYRAQARRLREKLEGYLGEHPDFTLKKMLLSGSLAKGTALRSLNDIDVACYISGADAPKDVPGAARLSGRAASQGVPELQPRPGAAADLFASRSPSGGPGSTWTWCRSSTTAIRNGTATSSARTTARS